MCLPGHTRSEKDKAAIARPQKQSTSLLSLPFPCQIPYKSNNTITAHAFRMTNKFTNHQSTRSLSFSIRAIRQRLTSKLCLAKALMKQEHWRLFTCNFGISKKLNTLNNGVLTCSNWISIVLPRVAQHGLTTTFRLQAQHVIQLQCQTRTRPALAHKVGEKLPKSPSPTSQPETTAIHHGFAPPFFTANKIQNQSPKTCCCSQYASCT